MGIVVAVLLAGMAPTGLAEAGDVVLLAEGTLEGTSDGVACDDRPVALLVAVEGGQWLITWQPPVPVYHCAGTYSSLDRLVLPVIGCSGSETLSYEDATSTYRLVYHSDCSTGTSHEVLTLTVGPATVALRLTATGSQDATLNGTFRRIA